MLWSALGALGLATAASFSACSGLSPTPQPRPFDEARAPSAPVGAPSGPSPSDRGRTAPGPQGELDAGAGGTPDALAPGLAAAAQCDEPRTAIVHHGDGGVVFNNAMTSADAGFIDRTQATIDALVGESQRFRCCFDLWGRGRPGERGELMLLLELAPDGQLRAARVDDERTTVDHLEARACVLDVARGIRYPASPTGRVTWIEYPFRVTGQTDEPE